LVGCYIRYIEEGIGRGRSPPKLLLATPPNPLLAAPMSAHPSAASVPITVLLYNGLLLCDYNVSINGLRHHIHNTKIYTHIATLHMIKKIKVYTHVISNKYTICYETLKT